MKWLTLLLLFSGQLWSKNTVLISYYDAFGRASFNNSEVIAKELLAQWNDESIELKLCALNTVFDKSYAQLENCYQKMVKPPLLVLGLGEAGCSMKIELLGRNWDSTKGPDNEGNERFGISILPEASSYLGFTYPLSEMYCSLEKAERSDLVVSNDAGSFICNNTAFQFSHYYPEVHSGFIHLPANNCRGLARKNPVIVKNLKKMIKKAGEVILKDSVSKRLPIKKSELEPLRNSSDDCKREFFNRTRGVDEKFRWPFLN